MLQRTRDWRLDRTVDRVARRPHGRRARETYGADDDVHAFAWEPVLEALQLTADDALPDVGCGGGVFLRRALETGCGAVGVDHSQDMVHLAGGSRKGGRRSCMRPRITFRSSGIASPPSPRSWRSSSSPIRLLRCASSTVWSTPRGGRIAVFTTPPELKGTPAAPYPLANLGHFYEDSELETHARTAGFREVDVQRVLEGGQLIVARP